MGSILALLTAAALFGCGGDIPGPSDLDAIKATTKTTGQDPDPDGYTVTLDSGASKPVSDREAAVFVDLNAGSHKLTLAGLASNCAVAGPNPRTVMVSGAETTLVAIQVGCTAGTALKVTTTTTGINPDPDGYTVSIDGVVQQTIGADSSVTIASIPAGTHSVLLGDVAANCAVQGDNPRTVTATTGDTVEVGFTVTCAAVKPGGIQVTTATTTSGSLADPDGYDLSVDGGTKQHVGLNAIVSFTDLPPGSHSVLLTGLAGNCAVNGANPATAQVANNSTTPVSMAVTCGSTLKQNQILFLSTRDAGTATNIYVMNQDGSNVMRVTNTSFNDQDVAISPDGNTMVFSRIDQTAHYQVYRMRFDGSGPTKISTDPNANDSDPEWSPDGSKLAFESDESGSPEVWFMNPDGSGRVQLTNNGGENGDVDWSPDGSMIVFESHINGKSDVYVINTDGTGLTDLTPNTPNSFDTDPNWSPDGTMVTFGSDRALPGAGTSQGTYQVYVMNADGSNVRRVTQTSVKENAPAWSPDAKELAFQSELTGNTDVYTIDLDGSNRKRLTTSSAFDGFPEWTRPVPSTLLAATTSLRVARGVAAATAAAAFAPANVSGPCRIRPGSPGCRRTVVIPDWKSKE